MKPVHVVTDYHEKQLQRALLQYNRPDNADLVREALRKAGREDLIGFGPDCLVRPVGGMGGKPAPRKTESGGRGRKASPKGGTPKANGTTPAHIDKSALKKGGAPKGSLAPHTNRAPVHQSGSSQKGGTAPKGGRGRR